MKFYGIELAEGTVIQDLVCEGSTTFPTTNLAKGRLFFNTSSNVLHIYDGTNWVATSSTNSTSNGVLSVNNRTGAVNIQQSDLTSILPMASTSTLGAIKIGSGLNIDVNGIVTADVSSIPAGSRLLWAQPTAPVGWTQVTSIETANRMLRVVSTVGGTTGSGGTGGYGYGGTADPTIMNVVPSHTHSMSGSTDAVGDHTHGYQFKGGSPAGGADQWGGIPGKLGSTPTTPAGGHSHTISATISTNTGASNWTPQYLNLILCSKD